MRRNVILSIALWCLAAVVGCGGGSTDSNGSSASSSGGPATSSDALSDLDKGPRAAEAPFDAELAERGEKLFQLKGCSACHTFGQKMSGPDLSGVAGRRTAAWLEHQILHPEEMAKGDPIARGLIATHALQMPNQGLSQDEAAAVIEFLKSKEPGAESSDETSTEEEEENT